jgi:ubiquinone/menaquinone biosynthesis C-methylase UbiE
MGEHCSISGCNWGRWSIAAARKGYRVVGIDPSLGGVLAARRAAKSLSIEADFIVADARHLPFKDVSLDNVFSYSVIQHLSKPDALKSFAEIARILKPSGKSLIQMPNAFGIRNLYHQAPDISRGRRLLRTLLHVAAA